MKSDFISFAGGVGNPYTHSLGVWQGSSEKANKDSDSQRPSPTPAPGYVAYGEERTKQVCVH